jgi:hypothetical protein
MHGVHVRFSARDSTETTGLRDDMLAMNPGYGSSRTVVFVEIQVKQDGARSAKYRCGISSHSFPP